MKALSIAGTLAAALAFGTNMALAQTGTEVGNRMNPTPLQPQHSIGVGSAKTSDASNWNPVPNSYNVGSGAASIATVATRIT